MDNSRLFPGIRELVEELHRRQARLAVLSNKTDATVRRMISGLFPGGQFSHVRGERDGVPPKPDPTSALEIARELGVPPAECAFVGDSWVDMETAVAAGMYPVGVLWGFRDRAELVGHGARLVVGEPRELLRLA